MCDLCLQNPCDTRCPNAEEPKPVFICSGCGHDIYDGEDYYDVMGEQFCQKCIDNMRYTAEYHQEGDFI